MRRPISCAARASSFRSGRLPFMAGAVAGIAPFYSSSVSSPPARAATILWGRLATCGRLLIGLPGAPTMPEDARTVCRLLPCGAANLGQWRLFLFLMLKLWNEPRGLRGSPWTRSFSINADQGVRLTSDFALACSARNAQMDVLGRGDSRRFSYY